MLKKKRHYQKTGNQKKLKINLWNSWPLIRLWLCSLSSHNIYWKYMFSAFPSKTKTIESFPTISAILALLARVATLVYYKENIFVDASRNWNKEIITHFLFYKETGLWKLQVDTTSRSRKKVLSLLLHIYSVQRGLLILKCWEGQKFLSVA